MKKIKNLKKKIFGLTLVVGLLVLSIVGTTMAYFTDVEDKTNVFTSGNVDITLSGNVLLGADNATNITAYPGMSIGSAATVTNVGTENAYVGIIVSFNKEIIEANVRALFAGLGSEGYTVTYESANGTTKLYISYANPLKSGETDNSVTFFSGMTIPLVWNNEQMKIFNGLEINIAAYATQTYGFTGGARAALNEAFAEWN